MTTLDAGQNIPKITLPTLDGETATLGQPRGGNDWQLVVVYRGLHCPICKTYLETLDGMVAKFNEIGVDVLAISGDPEDRARKMAEEKGLDLALGYDLSLDQMRDLGLYISDPRSPEETDRPFAEPGVFVINAEGKVQIVDISNAPFARPDLERLLSGIGFVRDKDYPVRGTHHKSLPH